MSNWNYFKLNQEVEAHDLSGRKIIGIYKGPHNSFGVWLYGLIWGEDPILKMHHCSRLTLRPRQTKPTRKTQKRACNLQSGDPCKGLTKDNKEIIGQYLQAGPKGFAYIRGVVAKNGLASPFEALQVFKVTRESLTKQA